MDFLTSELLGFEETLHWKSELTKHESIWLDGRLTASAAATVSVSSPNILTTASSSDSSSTRPSQAFEQSDEHLVQHQHLSHFSLSSVPS